MTEMREYKVVRTDSARSLTNDVNACMRDGWQPFGGVSIAFYKLNVVGGQTNSVYAQAMVKREDK